MSERETQPIDDEPATKPGDEDEAAAGEPAPIPDGPKNDPVPEEG